MDQFLLISILASCITTILSENLEVNVSFIAPIISTQDGKPLTTLKCRVSGAYNDTTDDLAIFRVLAGGDVIPLAYETGRHEAAPDDVVFIGWFRPTDGNVFVLGISTTQTSGGEYLCKALRRQSINSFQTQNMANISVDSLRPPSGEPSCFTDPSEPTPLIRYEGSMIIASCVSDSGYPHVTLQWSSSGNHSIMPTESQVQMSTVNSSFVESSINITLDDFFDGITLTCNRTHAAYPNSDNACVIGPFHVKSDKLNPTPVSRITTDITTTLSQSPVSGTELLSGAILVVIVVACSIIGTCVVTMVIGIITLVLRRRKSPRKKSAKNENDDPESPNVTHSTPDATVGIGIVTMDTTDTEINHVEMERYGELSARPGDPLSSSAVKSADTSVKTTGLEQPPAAECNEKKREKDEYRNYAEIGNDVYARKLEGGIDSPYAQMSPATPRAHGDKAFAAFSGESMTPSTVYDEIRPTKTSTSADNLNDEAGVGYMSMRMRSSSEECVAVGSGTEGVVYANQKRIEDLKH